MKGFWLWLLLSLFLALSVGALIGGSILIFKNIDLRLFGEKTIGKIVDFEESSSLTNRDYKKAKRIHYFPVVAYTVNGKDYIVKSHSSADNIPKGKGDEVEIIYRISEPDYFVLQLQLKEDLVAGIASIFIGGIFTTIISLLIIHSLKERKKERSEKKIKGISF
jgi:hypothetical protein